MAVYTRLAKKDAAAIARRFGLGDVRAFDGIAKGSVNTNYRLETGRGTFFVRLDERRDARSVAREHRLLEHLAKGGFPTPLPLADGKGRRVMPFLSKPLCVFPWLPGADKEAHEYGPRDLGEAGAMLARLHLASQGFPERIPNRFGVAATAARWAKIRGTARIPATHRDEIDEAVAALFREPPPAGPTGVVHGDWFSDNLLFEKRAIIGVLDFEAAATEHLTFDVATAVNALCWLRSEPDRFRPARVRALLDGYREVGGPAPLDAGALSWWLRATALRFTVTRILDFRLRRSRLRVEKDYRDFLRRLRWWTAKAQ